MDQAAWTQEYPERNLLNVDDCLIQMRTKCVLGSAQGDTAHFSQQHKSSRVFSSPPEQHSVDTARCEADPGRGSHPGKALHIKPNFEGFLLSSVPVGIFVLTFRDLPVRVLTVFSLTFLLYSRMNCRLWERPA